MFFVLVGTILAAVFIGAMGGTEVGMVGTDHNRRLAFYAAEAGINRAIWKIKNSEPIGHDDNDYYWGRRITGSPFITSGGGFQVAGDADFSVDTGFVRWDGTATEDMTHWLLMKSKGSRVEETIVKTILEAESFRHVVLYLSSYRPFNATVEWTGVPWGLGPLQVDELPRIDFQYYRNIGIYHPGNYTFPRWPPVTGIHYVEGNATILASTIYGTVVAGGDIRIRRSWWDFLAIIYPTRTSSSSPFYPAYYPALVAGRNIIKDNNVLLLANGLIYARGDIVLNCTWLRFIVNGMVMGANVSFPGATFSSRLTYSSDYCRPVPGYVPTDPLVRIQPGSWEEK
jgi:hypothetical protein